MQTRNFLMVVQLILFIACSASARDWNFNPNETYLKPNKFLSLKRVGPGPYFHPLSYLQKKGRYLFITSPEKIEGGTSENLDFSKRYVVFDLETKLMLKLQGPDVDKRCVKDDYVRWSLSDDGSLALGVFVNLCYKEPYSSRRQLIIWSPQTGVIVRTIGLFTQNRENPDLVKTPDQGITFRDWEADFLNDDTVVVPITDYRNERIENRMHQRYALQFYDLSDTDSTDKFVYGYDEKWKTYLLKSNIYVTPAYGIYPSTQPKEYCRYKIRRGFVWLECTNTISRGIDDYLYYDVYKLNLATYNLEKVNAMTPSPADWKGPVPRTQFYFTEDGVNEPFIKGEFPDRFSRKVFRRWEIKDLRFESLFSTADLGDPVPVLQISLLASAPRWDLKKQNCGGITSFRICEEVYRDMTLQSAHEDFWNGWNFYLSSDGKRKNLTFPNEVVEHDNSDCQVRYRECIYKFKYTLTSPDLFIHPIFGKGMLKAHYLYGLPCTYRSDGSGNCGNRFQISYQFDFVDEKGKVHSL